MGNIQFLSNKEFAGKLRTTSNIFSSTGTLVSLTANTGKDMYLATNSFSLVNTDIGLLEFELEVNGVVLETIQLRNVVAEFSFFKTKGVMVEAGEVIEIVISSNPGSDDVSGTLQCFEEDTGASPSL